MNSHSNKNIGTQQVIRKLLLDYFSICKSKLDERFSSAQFHTSNYKVRNRISIDQNGDAVIEFARKVFITKRLKDYEA